ncbi:MAG TPA: hypothetical protein IGS17_15805 [Oscillatoriales cyanobacterium M59_W2019_021]|nr:MAG: hypothetical protein D6728_13625 [Cyanobacteria bacterium J055]HIK33380.1 hypothetical protein [Oscillatoriales cyanobacterium M4454_W2019_049]HIK52372.1 hypothetical protein [Oscillatoriales cyanobacterium M59_W2019_021]
MTNVFKFSQFPPKHWLMVVCLNLVRQRRLTDDEAIARILELGILPTLQYQWNSDRGEFDLLAIVQCDPMDEYTLSDEQIDRLWEIFGTESMLSMSTGDGDLSGVSVREQLEQTVPEPPPQPDWYVRPGGGDRHKTHQ